MNLYLFNAHDSAATYGIGTYLKELTGALDGANMNIHIVHLHSRRPEFEIVKTGHTEHWHIPEVRSGNTFSGSIQRVEDYYRNVIYLLRIHIKDTKDLIFHFNYNQSLALAKGLKEVFSCKTAVTVHFNKWALDLHGNLSRFQALKSKPENQRNSFEQLLYTIDEYEGLLYREADRVIALSQYTRNLLCSEYQLNPDKIAVIPNGLSAIDSVKTDHDPSPRTKWRIPEKEFIILFAGRLHAVKGPVFLIIRELPEDFDLFFPYDPREYHTNIHKNSPAKLLLNPNLREMRDWEPYLLGFQWGNSIYLINRKGADKLLAIDTIRQRLNDEILTLSDSEELNIYTAEVDWFDYRQLNQEIFDDRKQITDLSQQIKYSR